LVTEKEGRRELDALATTLAVQRYFTSPERPANLNIGFDVAGILGFVEIPTHCETSQPEDHRAQGLATKRRLPRD
jgi:hypothetical protein